MNTLCTQSAPVAIFTADGFPYSLPVMLDANRDDADICAWLLDAKVGDEFQAGGGAAAEILVKRVA